MISRSGRSCRTTLSREAPFTTRQAQTGALAGALVASQVVLCGWLYLVGMLLASEVAAFNQEFDRAEGLRPVSKVRVFFWIYGWPIVIPCFLIKIVIEEMRGS